MNNTIRAILVNPIAKTVTEIQMLNDFDNMKAEHIGCELAEVMDFGEGVDAWIDEEGMLKNWDDQGFTKFAGVVTLAGNVVLTGRKNGDMAALPDHITAELVRDMAVFVPPKAVRVPGTKITTIEPDGTLKTESIGPEELTYENQP